MPKKTRQQKVISAYRRKLKLLEQLNQTPLSRATKEIKVESTGEKIISKTPQQKKIEIVDQLPVTEKDLSLKIFFKQDLRKSLILIGLIIALEIIIYFGTINNYFRL